MNGIRNRLIACLMVLLLLPALLPASLGRETPPPPAAAVLPDRDPALLEMQDVLPDTRPYADFTLKTPRSIK